MSLAERRKLIATRDFIQDWREAAKMEMIHLNARGNKQLGRYYEALYMALDSLDAVLARNELDKLSEKEAG